MPCEISSQGIFVTPSVFLPKKRRSTKTFQPFLRFINEWFIFEENLG
jgi:hypothetical protein